MKKTTTKYVELEVIQPHRRKYPREGVFLARNDNNTWSVDITEAKDGEIVLKARVTIPKGITFGHSALYKAEEVEEMERHKDDTIGYHIEEMLNMRAGHENEMRSLELEYLRKMEKLRDKYEMMLSAPRTAPYATNTATSAWQDK